MKFTYDSNNSGGRWWLTDQNWKDLEAAGWDVHYVKPGQIMTHADDTGTIRFLGALATKASKEFETLGACIREWERVTGLDSSSVGCSCCGVPHTFEWKKDGTTQYWSTDRHETGSRYEGP